MHLGQFLGFITGQHWRKPMIFATIEPLLGLTYTHMVCGGGGGGNFKKQIIRGKLISFL